MIAWYVDEMRAHDRGLVFGAWKASYRESPFGLTLPDEVYIDHMQAKIERLLARSRVLVARPEGWPEGVLSWVCAQHVVDEGKDIFAVHYAYTRRRMRRRATGESLCWALIAKLAIKADRCVFTCTRPPYSHTFTKRGFAFAPEYASAREAT